MSTELIAVLNVGAVPLAHLGTAFVALPLIVVPDHVIVRLPAEASCFKIKVIVVEPAFGRFVKSKPVMFPAPKVTVKVVPVEQSKVVVVPAPAVVDTIGSTAMIPPPDTTRVMTLLLESCHCCKLPGVVALALTIAPMEDAAALTVIPVTDVDGVTVCVEVKVFAPVVAMFVTAPVDPLTDKTPVLAMVTADEPSNEVPDSPVLIVSALVVEALTVPEPPRVIAVPFTVTDEAANLETAIAADAETSAFTIALDDKTPEASE